ncbi:MAG: tellurite resistance/C4-dicarboxylate transporter family protein [Polyangiaceae bacterium]|nr:tellurite resistance/C4-dicarboxylate transporter family protein [Polyangiaceae bacterium]MCE7889729.1 C4-dicarboxylate ABC transporter [Sorangiineae bacterium PRO1]MCL4755608.1 tellurite resistance/C4-dicarboxylate transporter family protein [Myxococcales bacterium]
MVREAQARRVGPSGSWGAALLRVADGQLKYLQPAYFAMVMSTGIVSMACAMVGHELAATALLWLNLPLLATLVALTLLRVARFPREFVADWSDHQRGVGFFTIVASTCIVGNQHVMLRSALDLGKSIWWLGLALWCGCMYAIFTALTVRETKPSLPDGINGGWLVAVVATQSLCVLGCNVSTAFGASRPFALFAMLALWLCGGMLYIWTISLIFYRYTFFRFLPSDLMPPYWINMGAMAISTLAGTALIKNAEGSELLSSLLPFLKGFTLWYWATATWWVPMLVILAVWRHVVKRFPISYDPLYWGAVFPLGMYAACSFQLASVTGIVELSVLARRFVVVAIVAWSLAFAGFARRLFSLADTVRRERAGEARLGQARS